MQGRGGVALVAPAKVNLALHVTGRRPDGYHVLDSIAVFADLGDKVGVAPAGELSLEMTGRFALHAPGDHTDLAWRAAEAYFDRAGLTAAAAIRIEKHIPAGAGLGGGSADAAAVLLALDQIHNALGTERLAAIGLGLGADVPMCLCGSALRARGIGEDLERILSWPVLPLVLVWPGRPVSTAAAFSALTSRENPPLPEIEPAESPRAVADWLADCRNDLEAPALALAPEIGEALTFLRDDPSCLLARMSGSGSACFGLFESCAAAQAAATRIEIVRAGWWVAASRAS